ncbi:phage tail protein, partial [Heliobacterium chlorum]
VSYLSGIWMGVTQSTTSAWNACTQFLTSCWNTLSAMASVAFQAVRNDINGAMTTAQNVVSSVWGSIAQTWNSTLDGIQSWTTEKLTAMNTFISSAWETLKGIWDAGRVDLWDIAIKLWQGIYDTFAQAPVKLLACMTTIKKTLTDAWQLIKNDAIEMGKNVIYGFVNGITSMASYLYSAALGVFNRVTSAASKALDIHSPSRVMIEMGRYTAQGFALGINAETGMVTGAGLAMASAAVGSVGGYSYATSALTAPELTQGSRGNSFNITIHGSNGQEIWAELERQLIRRGVKF